MILIIESIVLCLLFTFMVYVMSRDPIKTIYNYPPMIQERVKSLSEYKDRIPTKNNKIVIKLLACFVFYINFTLYKVYYLKKHTKLLKYIWG